MKLSSCEEKNGERSDVVSGKILDRFAREDEGIDVGIGEVGRGFKAPGGGKQGTRDGEGDGIHIAGGVG